MIIGYNRILIPCVSDEGGYAVISTHVKSSNLSRRLLIHQKFIVMSKKVTTSSPKLFIGIDIHNLSRHQAGRRVGKFTSVLIFQKELL